MSVTDLSKDTNLESSHASFSHFSCAAAPGGWCEVQYAYSLLGRRDLKPEARVSALMYFNVFANYSLLAQPDTIITPAGTEIKVNKRISVAHDKVLQKGRDVHKVLELEVHPEQKAIKTESRADRWGLRYVQQMNNHLRRFRLG